MKIIPEKTLSPFSYAALSLDNEFKELDRLREQIERANIDSEKGLHQVPKLLEQFAACGLRIADGVQSLARTLNESREHAEEASRVVSERAAMVQNRQRHCEEIYARYRSLGTKATEITASMSPFKKGSGEAVSAEERAGLPKHLVEVDQRLALLIGEAEQIKQEARENRMDGLVREIHSLGQSLGSMRRKLAGLTELGIQAQS